jgi:hypothetical protein
MNDSYYTLTITILRACTYYIDNHPYSVFLEKWSYQGKDLYCIGTILYYENPNKILAKKYRYLREFYRSDFYSKDEADKGYNNRVEGAKLRYLDNIQIFDFIDDGTFNIRREYYIPNRNLRSDLWKDPYGRLDDTYNDFVKAYEEKFK